MSIAIVCTARPSLAKLEPVIDALHTREAVLQLYMCGSAISTRFGNVWTQIRDRWRYVDMRTIASTYEDQTLLTSAKETAGLLHSLADAFDMDRPDLVLVNHDRHEVLAAAMAAAYQNIPLAHIGGGEVSGNIDNRVRNAITALATYHFPATITAKFRLYGLTGSDQRIWHVGCPTIDTAIAAANDPPVTIDEIGGVGAWLDLSLPFLLVLQHSETENPETAYAQLTQTLLACERACLPALVIWPGADAGQEQAAKAIRVRTITHHKYPIHTVRTIPPRRFLRLLRQCTILVGNSSAGIRECSALGTPVVNIGQRQRGRERGPNVVDAVPDLESIAKAIWTQRTHGPYPRSELYGHGDAASHIATRLMTLVYQ